MKLLLALILSLTVFTANASEWKSTATVDMTQFSSSTEFATLLEFLDREVQVHGENVETGEQVGCGYVTKVDSVRVGGHLSFINLIFTHSGTPGFCDKSFIEDMWKEISQIEGVQLSPLVERKNY